MFYVVCSFDIKLAGKQLFSISKGKNNKYNGESQKEHAGKQKKKLLQHDVVLYCYKHTSDSGRWSSASNQMPDRGQHSRPVMEEHETINI